LGGLRSKQEYSNSLCIVIALNAAEYKYLICSFFFFCFVVVVVAVVVVVITAEIV